MNALRLAVGTLTVLPVRAPRVNRQTAGRAMVLAPLVGLLLALPASLLLLVTGTRLSPLVAAALTVGGLALLTRGLHLDGLADTADGLGSGRPAPEALDVMRKGDVGPFGVVALVLVLLVQVAALAQLLATGSGQVALVGALVASRLTLPLACLRGVPAARPEGLGATMAGTVSVGGALVSVLLATVLVGAVAGLAGSTVSMGLAVLASVGVGVLAGLALVWWAVRRLGGATGDVLGASVETAFTAFLVVLCFA